MQSSSGFLRFEVYLAITSARKNTVDEYIGKNSDGEEKRRRGKFLFSTMHRSGRARSAAFRDAIGERTGEKEAGGFLPGRIYTWARFVVFRLFRFSLVDRGAVRAAAIIRDSSRERNRSIDSFVPRGPRLPTRGERHPNAPIYPLEIIS